MERLVSPGGVRLSYDRYGSGPALVMVHGAFSSHDTNWEFVKPMLEQHFTVYALARRGRGETTATRGHRLLDESRDVASLIEAIGEPVFLLGHSYGAQVSLAAAREVPQRVRKLVLYEPPRAALMTAESMAALEALAEQGDWEGFAVTFFGDRLKVPRAELEALRRSELWPPIIADAEATLGDLRALKDYDFRPERFSELGFPVMLQVGSESPRELYATDALSAVLPDCRIEVLEGQAHEGMTTAPEQYADSVIRFFLGEASGR